MTSPDRFERPSDRTPKLRVVADVADVDPDSDSDSRSAGPRPQRRARRLGPQAARTAERARRTWFSLLFFPVFAVYEIVDAVREVRDRLARFRGEQREAQLPFERPEGMPVGDARSVADIAASIERFPYRPRRMSTSMAFQRDNGPDALGALLSPNPQISTIPHLYPHPFRQRLFTGDQGVQLSGMQAMHDRRGPALVIAHGLLMTKHFDAIIQLARRAFEQWGFHVVTFDMRGWGQSAWTTDAPSSGGYHEGRDIVEIARELHRDPRVTSVAGIGYSLGGASMLNAVNAQMDADGSYPIDGGIACVCAPSMIGEALRHVSTKPHWRDPYYGLFNLCQAAIRSTVRRDGLPRDTRTWLDLVQRTSAPYYGVDVDEFAERASATNFAHRIDSPVLALYAADDFVVTAQHAWALQDATANNPNVHLIVRDEGAHVSFGAVDPSWYYSTLRRWLEYWAAPAGVAPEDAPLD